MANHKRTWFFLNPEGEEIQVNDLKEFCAINSLNYSSMYQVGSDPSKEKTHQHYQAGPSQKDETQTKSKQKYALINEGLKLVTSFTDHRPTLAKESSISVQSIWRLISGQSKTVRGWYLVDDPYKIPVFERDKKGAGDPGIHIDLEGEADL